MTTNYELNIDALAKALAKIDDPEVILTLLRAMMPEPPQTRTIPLAQYEQSRAPRRVVKRAKSYERWNEESIATLRSLVAAGNSTRAIARAMGRSEKAIVHAKHKFANT